MDEARRIEADRKANTCNQHEDCAAADAAVAAKGGRWTRGTEWTKSERVMTAFHCSSEDCEDCFGC